MIRLGLISDTHDFFDPAIPQVFQGVDHILHAGDICKNLIINSLEQIAPVTTVLGNNDSSFTLRETEVVQFEGLRLLVHHIVVPGNDRGGVVESIARNDPQVIVFGHTHVASQTKLNGRLYVNPGYAGRPSGGSARTVATLKWDGTEVTVAFHSLLD